jgi:hypothetical protein
LQYNKDNGRVLNSGFKQEISMSGGKKRTVIEIDDDFYVRWNALHLDLGEAEKDLIIYTDGLGALEKRLMQKADDDFYKEFSKRLPEYLQRRDAKSDNRYILTMRAKAAAQSRKTVLKGKIEMMKMQFEEWRTRSADRRNSI